MRIGAAGSKRADPRATRRTILGFPILQRGIYIKRRILNVQLGIRLGEMEVGWQFFVPQRHGNLDQPRRACRNVQMANVGLHRTNRAELFRIGAHAKRFGQSGNFDGIAQRRRRSVRFDIRNRLRVKARQRMSQGNRFRLAFDPRRAKTHTLRAVIVQAHTLDHRKYLITVFDRIFKALQDHHAHTVAENRAFTARIKCARVSIRRTNISFVVVIAALLRHTN